MGDISDMDLNQMLASIKPSVITPKLGDIQNLANEKKIKVISGLIVKSMVDDYQKDKKLVPRTIIHDGKITEFKYFDIEPLLTGVWPAMSLALLNLSYGEQTALIESIYPKAVQFTAKAFAATFTPESSGTSSKPLKYEMELDEVSEKKLDSANAGIAMIIAMLDKQGASTPHPDSISKHAKDISALVDAAEKEASYANATKRAQDAMQSRD